MDNLVDPAEPLDVQVARLKKISHVLMRRVETQTDRDGAAYSQFERAVVLEDQVRRRTGELERALRLLNESNASLSAANHQIEAARRAITGHVKRGGKVWIRIFPDKPMTRKPAETRMGSGKGAPELWVVRIKPGRVMFEIDGVPVQTAKEALSLAAAKLPIKTRFVARIAE